MDISTLYGKRTCLTDESSHICDINHFISKYKREQINQYINEISTQNEYNIKCEKRYMNIRLDIKVVIIESLNNNMDDDLYYANKMYSKWNIGDKLCHYNNGILIFIHVEKKLFHIVSGKYIHFIISREFISDVKSNVQPLVNNENYAKAIEYALDNIVSVFEFYRNHYVSTIKISLFKQYKMYKKNENIKRNMKPLLADQTKLDIVHHYSKYILICLIIPMMSGFIYIIYIIIKDNDTSTCIKTRNNNQHISESHSKNAFTKPMQNVDKKLDEIRKRMGYNKFEFSRRKTGRVPRIPSSSIK